MFDVAQVALQKLFEDGSGLRLIERGFDDLAFERFDALFARH